jgi:hypothetical protein
VPSGCIYETNLKYFAASGFVYFSDILWLQKILSEDFQIILIFAQ